jgi:hypothetical protein
MTQVSRGGIVLADRDTGGWSEEEIQPAREGAPERAPVIDAAALRDAEAIAERVAADESGADAERARLTAEPLPSLPASDSPFQVRLGEQLHAVRRAAILERSQAALASGGTLYLTSHRLVHIGTEAAQEIELNRIQDMAVSMERLLLIELADGSDLAIEVDQPRLLRVQLAAARAVAREGAQ